MKIKSKTNIITNSSTEVFSIVNKDTIKKMKEFIDLFLEFTGYPKRCDDLFDIALDPSAGDESYIEGWNDMTEKEKLEYLEENIYEEYVPPIYLSITPKEGVEVPVQLVSYLDTIGNGGFNDCISKYW